MQGLPVQTAGSMVMHANIIFGNYAKVQEKASHGQ
jgi:hypothetical protein